MATRTRKRVTKIDTSKPMLVVENGEVKEVAQPVIEEIEVDEEETESGVPTWKIKTPNGMAVYEYVGNCIECEGEKKETALFKCVSYPISAHGELGDQLAAFVREGPMCQAHYARHLGQQPRQPTAYKVIERH